MSLSVEGVEWYSRIRTRENVCKSERSKPRHCSQIQLQTGGWKIQNSERGVLIFLVGFKKNPSRFNLGIYTQIHAFVVSCSMNNMAAPKDWPDSARLCMGRREEDQGSKSNQINNKDRSKGFCLIEQAAAKDSHTSILTAGSPLPRMYAVCISLISLMEKPLWGCWKGDDGIDEVAE